MKAQMKGISLMIILLMLVLTVQAAALRGTVTDKATKEPLIGAAVQLSGTNTGTITDVDGNFELAGLRNGTYTVRWTGIFRILESVISRPCWEGWRYLRS